MTLKSANILLLGTILIACSDQEVSQQQDVVSFVGSWKFVSHIVSDCTQATDNKENRCTGTAAECGVLTLTDNTWSWEQTLSDGSVFTEGGTFYLSTNTIILTGPDSPGSLKYSINGSAMVYTKTTLSFISNGITDGCTYTQTYSRYTLITTAHG